MNSQTTLQPVRTMSNLLTLLKDKCGQAEDLPIPNGQNSDLNSTDLVKQTVSQI